MTDSLATDRVDRQTPPAATWQLFDRKVDRMLLGEGKGKGAARTSMAAGKL